eukprot:CAMPEP_0202923792 /NCGR_PEP_ID=MMETSP1392-20130828/78637_1 /ASSEMBLY_ACC=CAM_ASM_000868 /TAXON_ID=225041 /ORGANISM="Chlamydomonas chlamydogama, Strain SAG 11-48b" /LENGTH=42 /DNA_ID= /DNA_START= /DNA_END= /DNA_ORIENTATION=
MVQRTLYLGQYTWAHETSSPELQQMSAESRRQETHAEEIRAM